MNIPLKDGTVGRLQNVPVTTNHEQEPSDSDTDDIKWLQKEEYQQLLDELKRKEVGTVKILKKA